VCTCECQAVTQVQSFKTNADACGDAPRICQLTRLFPLHELLSRKYELWLLLLQCLPACFFVRYSSRQQAVSNVGPAQVDAHLGSKDDRHRPRPAPLQLNGCASISSMPRTNRQTINGLCQQLDAANAVSGVS
jgi:hypothetical protein